MRSSSTSFISQSFIIFLKTFATFAIKLLRQFNEMYSYRKVFNHYFLANVLILQPELVVRSRENIDSPMPGMTCTKYIYDDPSSLGT